MLGNLDLILTGFAVVMSVLAAIWALCEAMGRVFTGIEQRAAQPVPAPAAPPPVPAGIPPHHLAAISAAVAETLGGGVRITRVEAPAHQVTDWPLEGRIEAFAAHHLRTDWGPTRPVLRTPNDSERGSFR